MLRIRMVSLAICVAAVLWRLAFPAQIEAAAFQHVARPPPQMERIGVADALPAAAGASFSIFPASGANGQVPGAGNLRLQGTLLTPTRQAALISIGGAKPQWIAVGEPAAGLEVVELNTGSAVVRTASGDAVSLEMFKKGLDAEGHAVEGTGNAPS